MTAHLCLRHYTSFGVSFQLASDSSSLLTAMLECSPLDTQECVQPPTNTRCYSLRGSARTGFRFSIDDEVVGKNMELPPLLEQLARELMVHVADYAPDRVFMHAGVVGWQGRALVFPGKSLVGKTTLVAELARAGADYYSDEYAVLDDLGRVHPYSRDLQMRRPGSRQQSAVAVEHLGGTAGRVPLSVGSVVFTEYRRSGRWQPKPLSPGTAALEMLRHAIPVQRTPARVMATFAKMMEQATAIRSERGEASEVASILLSAKNEEMRFL